MKLRDKILSGILLILIGIMLGMILMLFRDGSFQLDLAEVKVTEVNRSEEPFWSDEDLEKIDDRFIFRTAAKKSYSHCCLYRNHYYSKQSPVGK